MLKTTIYFWGNHKNAAFQVVHILSLMSDNPVGPALPPSVSFSQLDSGTVWFGFSIAERFGTNQGHMELVRPTIFE